MISNQKRRRSEEKTDNNDDKDEHGENDREKKWNEMKYIKKKRMGKLIKVVIGDE